MENEQVNINSADSTADASTNSALVDAINKNSETLNQIQEFLILQNQDRLNKEEEQKKQDAKEAKEEAEKADQQAKEEAEIQASRDASQEEVTQTYTELLQNIDEQVSLHNNLMAGQLFFFGIITGLLIAKIFLDRFIRI